MPHNVVDAIKLNLDLKNTNFLDPLHGIQSTILHEHSQR